MLTQVFETKSINNNDNNPLDRALHDPGYGGVQHGLVLHPDHLHHVLHHAGPPPVVPPHVLPLGRRPPGHHCCYDG